MSRFDPCPVRAGFVLGEPPNTYISEVSIISPVLQTHISFPYEGCHKNLEIGSVVKRNLSDNVVLTHTHSLLGRNGCIWFPSEVQLSLLLNTCSEDKKVETKQIP